MTILRVCYRSGMRFDEDYYLSKHVPLARDVMQPHGLTNIEVAKFTSGRDGSEPLYQIMFSAHFKSLAGFQSAMQSPGMSQVIADVANFYDGAPELLVGELIKTGS